MTGWADVSPDLREVIERVCTRRELEVLKMKAAGAGRRTISLALGISESAVRDRLNAAQRKIQAELDRLDETVS